jgi:hypothetical protein
MVVTHSPFSRTGGGASEHEFHSFCHPLKHVIHLLLGDSSFIQQSLQGFFPFSDNCLISSSRVKRCLSYIGQAKTFLPRGHKALQESGRKSRLYLSLQAIPGPELNLTFDAGSGYLLGWGPGPKRLFLMPGQRWQYTNQLPEI